MISEILAGNQSGIRDGNGDYSDWIEIWNSSDVAVDLGGHYLTDDQEVMAKWEFPSGTMLAANGRMIVFASGKQNPERWVDDDGNLHASFSLSITGEYLALVAPDGNTIVSGFEEGYPAQRVDFSWSADGYFRNPTPGDPEDADSRFDGFVEDTKFSVDRGFFTEPFNVELTSASEEAAIFYTLDGSEPGSENGTLYESPIEIATTTVLRAKAFKDGFEPTNTDTQTYLFLNHVLRQSQDHNGYPTTWGGVRADYEMDREVVDDPAYRDDFLAAFTKVPTLSLVTHVDNWFDRSSGIYQRPTSEGSRWERPVSAEFFSADNSEPGFSINCGIRIQGGSSRQTDIPKHAFSLRFREDYGPGSLRYPLFNDGLYGRGGCG